MVILALSSDYTDRSWLKESMCQTPAKLPKVRRQIVQVLTAASKKMTAF
jgi:ribosomal protein L29